MDTTQLNGAFGKWDRYDIIVCALHAKCRIMEKFLKLLATHNPKHGCSKINKYLDELGLSYKIGKKPDFKSKKNADHGTHTGGINTLKNSIDGSQVVELLNKSESIINDVINGDLKETDDQLLVTSCFNLSLSIRALWDNFKFLVENFLHPTKLNAFDETSKVIYDQNLEKLYNNFISLYCCDKSHMIPYLHILGHLGEVQMRNNKIIGYFQNTGIEAHHKISRRLRMNASTKGGGSTSAKYYLPGDKEGNYFKDGDEPVPNLQIMLHDYAPLFLRVTRNGLISPAHSITFPKFENANY